MSEADLCDDEPWNKQAEPTRAPAVVVSLHSVYHCVTCRIPIFSAPGQRERRVAESATPEPLPPPVLFCGFSGGVGGLTSVSPFSANATPVEPSPSPTDDVFYNADGVVAACPRCNEGIVCGAEHRHPGTGLRMTVRAGDAVLHEALDILANIAGTSPYTGQPPAARIKAMSSELNAKASNGPKGKVER